MAEAPTTKVTADALDAAAKKLDGLFDDTSAFENLEKFEDLEAGYKDFDSANWLLALVDDRLKGVQAHGDAMKSSITDLAEKLRKIAKNFRDADEANADALQDSSLKVIDTWVGDTVDISFDDAEYTDTVWQGQDTKDTTHGDAYKIDKGAPVYGPNGAIDITLPKSIGRDDDKDNIAGLFDDANSKNDDGTDFKYDGGFIHDDDPDWDNKKAPGMTPTNSRRQS